MRRSPENPSLPLPGLALRLLLLPR